MHCCTDLLCLVKKINLSILLIGLSYKINLDPTFIVVAEDFKSFAVVFLYILIFALGS